MSADIQVRHISQGAALVTALNHETYCFDLVSWEFHDYTLGFAKPNYPVPCTLFHVAMAQYHSPNHWWHWEWTKRKLKL